MYLNGHADAVTAARHTGWATLCAEQLEYLDDFWDRADVRLARSPMTQSAAAGHPVRLVSRAAGGARQNSEPTRCSSIRKIQ